VLAVLTASSHGGLLLGRKQEHGRPAGRHVPSPPSSRRAAAVACGRKSQDRSPERRRVFRARGLFVMGDQRTALVSALRAGWC
jgi:hypothetical protein